MFEPPHRNHGSLEFGAQNVEIFDCGDVLVYLSEPTCLAYSSVPIALSDVCRGAKYCPSLHLRHLALQPSSPGT